MKQHLQAYEDIEISTKSPVDLLLKIYDGALQSLAATKNAYEKSDFQTGYLSLEKTRRFVVHLYTTLDFDKGGAIAEDLGKLYVFVLNQIDMVEATKELDRIDSCTKVLTNIRDGWCGIKSQPANAKLSGSASSEHEYFDTTLAVTA